MMKLRGETSREVARRLTDHLNGPKVPRLYLLPYNRFNLTGENTWWLAPTPENPAYPHGKLFCSNADLHCGPDEVRCGLHVEKGVEQAVDGSDISHILTPAWRWHRFVAALVAGEVDPAVRRAAAVLKTPLRIQIVVSAAGGEKETFNADADGSALTAVVLKPNPHIKVLAPLKGCTGLRDLGSQLNSTVRKAAQWFWIDVYVSGLFRLTKSGGDDVEKCVEMLEKFEPWVHNT
jgi:hypothetical protein